MLTVNSNTAVCRDDACGRLGGWTLSGVAPIGGWVLLEADDGGEAGGLMTRYEESSGGNSGSASLGFLGGRAVPSLASFSFAGMSPGGCELVSASGIACRVLFDVVAGLGRGAVKILAALRVGYLL